MDNTKSEEALILQIEHAIIDKLKLSDDEKSFLKTSLWTQGEIPEIRSEAEYRTYEKISNELGSSLPERSSPDFGKKFLEWTRSREGILATSYGARMIEWEQREV